LSENLVAVNLDHFQVSMIEENVIKDRQQSLLASAPIYYTSGGCFDTHAKGEIFTLIGSAA